MALPSWAQRPGSRLLHWGVRAPGCPQLREAGRLQEAPELMLHCSTGHHYEDTNSKTIRVARPRPQKLGYRGGGRRGTLWGAVPCVTAPVGHSCLQPALLWLLRLRRSTSLLEHGSACPGPQLSSSSFSHHPARYH